MFRFLTLTLSPQTNFLSHFLLISKLLPDMAEAEEARVITVGSVTGNDNTVGGGGVYPVADLKQLDGLKAGFKNPVSMLDGYNFIGAKAYKDSKLVLMMTANMLHDRYHKQTGIAFSSIYPGCIAESPLFREKRPWFRKYFPVFMKFVTGGFVGEEEVRSCDEIQEQIHVTNVTYTSLPLAFATLGLRLASASSKSPTTPVAPSLEVRMRGGENSKQA